MDAKHMPVIPAERSDDLHHLELVTSCDLALFMAGNQFMAMKELVAAFQKECPQVANIFYETLPPGLELKQILAGGAVFNQTVLDIYPDIYSSVNLESMQTLERSGHLDASDYHLYLHNRLALLVPAGNPAGIKTVQDLGRDDVRISQPDPANEDIAYHIMDMYRAAGGETLVQHIMETKRALGTTVLTVVHHRETPLRIRKRTVDAGPVWATEAIHARTTDLPFEVVEPGERLDQRDRINYYICKLKRAPHPENAQLFLDFIMSPTAQQIYARHGFTTHDESFR